MKIDEYLESLPTIPPITTEEEESLFPSGDSGIDSQGQHPAYSAAADRHGESADGNPSLDSLSAAAAAAAAVRGAEDTGHEVNTPSPSPVNQAGSTQTLPPVPAPASSAA